MTILTHLAAFVLGAVLALEFRREIRRQTPLRSVAPLQTPSPPQPEEPKLDGVSNDNPEEPEGKNRRQRARGFFA